MSKPHIDAKTMAMIYKTRDAIEEIEKGAGEKFAKNFDIGFNLQHRRSEVVRVKYKHEMLDISFNWYDVDEDWRYWDSVYEKLRDLEEGAS